MPKTEFYVVDHEDATEKTVAELSADMIGSFIDDIIGGSKNHSDFTIVETDLKILHEEVKDRYQKSLLKKPMRLFKIKVSIEAQEIGKDEDV